MNRYDSWAGDHANESRNERTVTQVLEGAESWSFGSGDVGALVIHGFTSNPSGLRPLAQQLADAGFAVEMPLLPGHGTTWQHLARTGWRDWAREVIDAFELLRQRTQRQVAVGLSMGGTLALHLGQHRGDDLAGLVLINPVVRVRDPRLKLLWLLKRVLPSLPGIGGDIADPEGDEMAYDRVPLKAVASMVEFQRTVRDNLSRVSVPTLVFTSREDHVVDPVNSTMIMEGVSSTDREQIWLERSYHVATLDYDADLIVERTIAFIKRVAG